ncbi:HAD hydrolase-like protein [Paenibacillus sp. 32352]|uniref:HAD hydrolase-like protein n=1 Tax=Paenibacillus sp. 32352 TaxID=1969111 RepID=UPI0009ABE26F|nr:HAD hydrolase-like protein [Paenibacillus sp. 32352]
MKNYNAVLFDLDGTLLDTTKGVLSSVQYVMEVLQLPKISDPTLKTFIGPPIQESLVRVFGMTSTEAQSAANLFRDRYKNHDLLLAELYPNILSLLQMLKERNIQIAVATYKRQDYAIEILKHFGISNYCSCIFGADNDNKLTKQDIINQCIDFVGLAKEEMVMIGDSSYDAIGAEKAGVDFIGVTYGFGFKSRTDIDCHNHVGIADNATQLKELLLADATIYN